MTLELMSVYSYCSIAAGFVFSWVSKKVELICVLCGYAMWNVGYAIIDGNQAAKALSLAFGLPELSKRIAMIVRQLFGQKQAGE